MGGVDTTNTTSVESNASYAECSAAPYLIAYRRITFQVHVNECSSGFLPSKISTRAGRMVREWTRCHLPTCPDARLSGNCSLLIINDMHKLLLLSLLLLGHCRQIVVHITSEPLQILKGARLQL